MPAAITSTNLAKRYRAGAGQESLREALRSLPRRILRAAPPSDDRGVLWALKDVSFELQRGEVLGVVGQNGAGKTTLLKLLSRVTRPTLGQLETVGRVSALIELGAGFHPDLTGRENAYLNGVILGLSRREVDKNFDSIVEFSGLEQFMDTPVKRYSSGMYARLAFAVAAHTNPDILLVDEILSVGDNSFQRKCFDFIQRFVKSGRTSVFVSHSLYAIEQLCHRVLWLDSGEVVQFGRPGEVLRNYMDHLDRKLASGSVTDAHDTAGWLRIRNVRLLDERGHRQTNFRSGQDILVEVDYAADSRVERPYFVITVQDAQSSVNLFAANMVLDEFDAPDLIGHGRAVCRFRHVPLMPRVCNLWVEVYDKDRAHFVYEPRILASFRVREDPLVTDNPSEERGRVRFSRDHAVMKVPYSWTFEVEDPQGMTVRRLVSSGLP